MDWQRQALLRGGSARWWRGASVPPEAGSKGGASALSALPAHGLPRKAGGACGGLLSRATPKHRAAHPISHSPCIGGEELPASLVGRMLHVATKERLLAGRGGGEDTPEETAGHEGSEGVSAAGRGIAQPSRAPRSVGRACNQPLGGLCHLAMCILPSWQAASEWQRPWCEKGLAHHRARRNGLGNITAQLGGKYSLNLRQSLAGSQERLSAAPAVPPTACKGPFRLACVFIYSSTARRGCFISNPKESALCPGIMNSSWSREIDWAV